MGEPDTRSNNSITPPADTAPRREELADTFAADKPYANSSSAAQKRNAFRTVVIFFVASTIAFVIELYLAAQSQRWQMWAIAAIGGVIAIVAAGCIYLVRRERPRLAVKLLIIVSLLSVLVAPLLISGFGLILGLGTVLVVLTIAPQVLRPKEVNRTLISSVGVAVIAGAIDLWSPPSQLIFPAAQNLILIIGAVILLVYSLLTVRQFSSYTLPTKLIVAFLTVSLIPLGILAFLNASNMRAALIADANRTLFAAALQTAAGIDAFLDANRTAVRTESQLPALVDYFGLPENQRAGSAQEANMQASLREFSRKDRAFIESYALLDAQGMVVAGTDLAELGQNLAGQDYFQRPLETGLDYVSSVQFSETDSEPVLYFSSPVRNGAKETVGVLVARYNAAVLQQLVVRNNDVFGEQTFGILLDEHYIRLAHGHTPSLRFLPVEPLPLNQAAQLQTDRRLSAFTAANPTSGQPDFAVNLDNRIIEPYFTTHLAATGDTLFSAAATELDRKPWVMVFVQPQEIFLAPIQNQIRSALFLAIAMAGLVAAVAFAVGQWLAKPLVSLTDTVSQFTAGNLSARTSIQTADETGILAASFNKMAKQVGKLLTGLEERTRELELSQSVIFAVSELSKAGLDTERLLDEAVTLLQTRFGLYNVLLMLVDEKQDALVLRAGSGQVTQPVRDERFTIPLSHPKSVMARATRTRQTVVVDNVTIETNFMEHPLLPETQSEVAIPLVSRGNLLGVLDIQDSRPYRFSRIDVETFVTLSGYLATALENALLFEQIQAAKNTAESANRAKSVFLANMSHEFRTPLHAIIGYSEMLEEEADDDSRQELVPDLQKIQVAGHHLLTLINDILDLSKIEAGKMDLYLEEFDVSTLIDTVVSTIQPVMEKNKNTFLVDFDSNVALMQADPVKVRQVLFNLLSNAAKFTHQGTVSLTISRIGTPLNGEAQATADSEWMRFSVTDTGIGMSAEQLESVFKAFIQADMSTTRKYGGTGLGLAISQRLCKMMGGYITVQSQPGHGSTFEVYLPVNVEAELAEQLERVRPET